MFRSMLQSRDGDLATPSAIFFLLSSATVSSVTAAAVEFPSPRTKIDVSHFCVAVDQGYQSFSEVIPIGADL